jgi:hypothetical protein
MLRTIARLPAFLYAQRVKGFDPPTDEPFMDPEGVERFKYELSHSSRYVEFGSGGTTVLADRKGVPTISVESDRFYARAVATRLSSGCVKQIVVDIGFTGEWGTPICSTPEKGRKYATAPFGGEFPDLILVDGRYRVACALESARRAYQAGAKAILIFDDYAARPHYHRVEQSLGSPEMAGRTAIFAIGSSSVCEETVEAALSDKS